MLSLSLLFGVVHRVESRYQESLVRASLQIEEEGGGSKWLKSLRRSETPLISSRVKLGALSMVVDAAVGFSKGLPVVVRQRR